MNSKNLSGVQGLFNDAQDDGLGTMSANILVENLSTLTLAGANGPDANTLVTDEVTLFISVLDQSSSMGGEHDNVISAYNKMIDALTASREVDKILMSTWFFDTKPHLFHSFLPLASVVRLDRSNYQPSGMTALYDTTLDALTSVVAYGQDLRNSGIVTKVVIVIFTDGEDNSSRDTAGRVNTVITDLLQQEFYTTAFVAFGVNVARDVARQMGIPDDNVLSLGSTESEIRRAMDTVSASVIRTSQSSVGQSGSFFT